MKKQTICRITALCILTIGLASCDARPQSQLDKRNLLDKLLVDGPKVTGVSAALEDSAKAAEESKNYDRALQFYEQLLDKNPDNVKYRLKYAENLRRAEQPDKALQYYNVVLKETPDDVVALEGKGLTLITKGDFTEAGNVFEQVMAQDAKRWRTLNGVGLLFVSRNMPDEALAYFDSALENAPDEPTVLNNKGLTQALQADYPKAIDTLNRASSKVKTKSLERKRIDLNLALVLGLSGDLNRAENVAERHLSEVAVQNNLGFYAKLANDDKLAKAYLNSAISGSSTFYERAWQNLEDMK